MRQSEQFTQFCCYFFCPIFARIGATLFVQAMVKFRVMKPELSLGSHLLVSGIGVWGNFNNGKWCGHRANYKLTPEPRGH